METETIQMLRELLVSRHGVALLTITGKLETKCGQENQRIENSFDANRRNTVCSIFDTSNKMCCFNGSVIHGGIQTF